MHACDCASVRARMWMWSATWKANGPECACACAQSAFLFGFARACVCVCARCPCRPPRHRREGTRMLAFVCSVLACAHVASGVRFWVHVSVCGFFCPRRHLRLAQTPRTPWQVASTSLAKPPEAPPSVDGHWSRCLCSFIQVHDQLSSIVMPAGSTRPMRPARVHSSVRDARYLKHEVKVASAHPRQSGSSGCWQLTSQKSTLGPQSPGY